MWKHTEPEFRLLMLLLCMWSEVIRTLLPSVSYILTARLNCVRSLPQVILFTKYYQSKDHGSVL